MAFILWTTVGHARNDYLQYDNHCQGPTLEPYMEYSKQDNTGTGTSGSGYELIGSIDASSASFSDEAVVNDVPYYYVVSAVYTGGAESEFTNEASATPAEFVPTAPTNLEATAADSQVDLTWNAPDDGGDGGGRRGGAAGRDPRPG